MDGRGFHVREGGGVPAWRDIPFIDEPCWHSHPGVLIGTVKTGSIDFYKAKCEKRTIAAGEVFQENDGVHGIISAGGADLWITYLIKHNMPRRIDESAPSCAVTTGIP